MSGFDEQVRNIIGWVTCSLINVGVLFYSTEPGDRNLLALIIIGAFGPIVTFMGVIAGLIYLTYLAAQVSF